MEERVPLVSVVCLTMNHARFVERSYRSLVDQSFRDFEIIYLDNNSTDNTFEIADAIFRSSGLPYRSFRRTENYGVAANVNFLLKLVRAPYIAALSGDDFWELTNLEEKMKYAIAHPEFGMVYGAGYRYFYDTGRTELMDTTGCKSGWIFKDLLQGNFINGIGFIIRKETLDNVGLFDENSMVEDWDLWLRISERYQIGFFEKPMIYYGQQTGSNISANADYMDKGAEYIFSKYAHHKEIAEAKKKYWLYRVYQRASAKPSMANFKFILKNFQFNAIYFKQLVKFFGNVLGFKKQG
jgi:alpha-1,3-rhamnosyltransferase